MKLYWTTFMTTGIFASLLLAGCSPDGQTNTPVEKAAVNTNDSVSASTREGMEEAEKVGDAAAEAAKDVAQNTEDAVDGAAITGRVKTALLNAADLETKDLNVETVKQTIHLKGSVPSQEQKDKATKLASMTAGKSFAITNELTIQK